MKLFTESKESRVSYADTIIEKVVESGESVLVSIECYDQTKDKLSFQKAKLIQLANELPERVETAQTVKLKNGRKRLFLFDDEDEIILEIEFDICI
jgi:hypothetical protein